MSNKINTPHQGDEVLDNLIPLVFYAGCAIMLSCAALLTFGLFQHICILAMQEFIT